MVISWHGLEALEPRLMLDGGPIVTAVAVNGGCAQRSVLSSLSVTFDRGVRDTVSTDDLLLTRADTGQPMDLGGALLSYEPSTNTATWTFAALEGDGIGDGFYGSRLPAAGISDAAGHPLDGNRDGQPGDDYAFGLFRMAGDTNGDGSVDPADLELVRANFLKPAGEFDPNADTNADGAVNVFDLRTVRQNYLATAQPPVPLDLARTPAEAAAALYYRPERIYEYVLNSFRYEPYAGSMKGAAGAMETRAGNAWDQSALLVEMLDEAGVYCRFVTAEIEADPQSVMDWLGAKDAVAAGDVLANANLDSTVVHGGSGVMAIRFDHAWVEAFLPDGAGGREWKAMDPSWKFRDFQEGVPDLMALVPFDEEGYLSQVQQELAYEYYAGQVAEYLAANMPGTSLADVPYDGPIVPRKVDVIDGALPCAVIGSRAAYARLPVSMTHRVRIRLTDSWDFTTYSTTASAAF